MKGDPHAAPSSSVAGGASRLAALREELSATVATVERSSESLCKRVSERGLAEFAADLTKIHAAGERLQRMIHDVLDPSRTLPTNDELGKRIRHDLRTPLNHIIGYCDLWLEEAEDHRLDDFVANLKEIKSRGQHALALLDELLQVACSPTTPPASPVAPPQTVVPSPTIAAAAARPARPAEHGAVLVVDDNADNRDLLTRWLRNHGHHVTAAEDGHKALELVREQPFDLILLDVIMPDLNGFQVLAQLKDDEVLRHLPVIMVSALDEIDAVVHCIESGAEDYLTKPFNPVLLRARINACLEKKRLRDREVQYIQQIRKEQARSDELLHVILPAEAVRELKSNNTVLPRRYEDVAVLFADLVGFTPFCDGHPPEYVVNHLQGLIETWEEIALHNQVEKIKTIGDAFMAASGLLRKTTDHPVLHAIRCGLEMIKVTQSLSVAWNLRVGIHLGPVVAGVIGKRQYLFDLWGDTVNTAARMESHGIPGQVVLSGGAWAAVANRCRGESRGVISVKGKGQLEMVRFDGFLET
jgi:CheY-like chemotaxis protein